jgi:hypothetical protein
MASEARRLSRDHIWQAAVAEIFRRLQAGDTATLRAMGLSDEHIERLASLSLADLLRVAPPADELVALQLQPDRLDSLLKVVDLASARDRLVEQCLRLGACSPMMRFFFQMTTRELREAQSRFGVSIPVGRPRALSPEEAHRLYDAWDGMGTPLTAMALVRLAEATGLPIHAVWRELQAHPGLAGGGGDCGGDRGGDRGGDCGGGDGARSVDRSPGRSRRPADRGGQRLQAGGGSMAATG